MAKKKTKTVKEQLLEVIHECNAEYKDRWKAAWELYKTIIGPFIKGTATYIWNLIYGSLVYLGKVIYRCGKILYAALVKMINKI